MELQNFDRWLDGTLAELGEAEPRRGLESRVLANLRAEQTQMRTRRFRGALAIATATVVICVLWLGGLGVHNQQTQLTNSDRAVIAPIVPIPTQSDAPKPANRRPSHNRRAERTQRKANQQESTPRLDQFPSPRHLSPQEGMLITYLREAPRTEIIAAEKQAHEISDLRINNIAVPALDSENANSQSSQTR